MGLADLGLIVADSADVWILTRGLLCLRSTIERASTEGLADAERIEEFADKVGERQKGGSQGTSSVSENEHNCYDARVVRSKWKPRMERRCD